MESGGFGGGGFREVLGGLECDPAALSAGVALDFGFEGVAAAGWAEHGVGDGLILEHGVDAVEGFFGLGGEEGGIGVEEF